MTIPTPQLSEFRLERKDNGLVHVVFDALGRTMNVFPEAAIVEIGRIARWLEEADMRGAVTRSGKASGFCALPEIWAAYDMIVAMPERPRFTTTYDHFFRLSLALRALETCGQAGRRRDRGLGAGGRRRTRARLALPRADRRQIRGDRSSRVPGGAASRRRRNSEVAASRRGRGRDAAPSGRRPAFWRSGPQGGSCPRCGQTGRGDRGRRRLAAGVAVARAAVGPRRLDLSGASRC